MNIFEKDKKETEDFDNILTGLDEQGVQQGHSLFFRLNRKKRDAEEKRNNLDNMEKGITKITQLIIFQAESP